MDDANRMMLAQAMGGGAGANGMLQQAMMAKMMRGGQIQAALEGPGAAPVGPGAPPAIPGPQGAGPGMSQAQFSGYGGGGADPAAQARQQAALAAMLRNRR